MIVASAGHPPALIVDTDGVVTESPEPGPLLGAFEDSRWEQRRCPSVPTSSSCSTPTASPRPPARASASAPSGLRRLLSEHAREAPSALLRSLDEALVEFRGGPARDDVAALAFRPRP